MSTVSSDNTLLAEARAAAHAAYAPYSGVSVGAAIETQDGQVFTGCNVENASLGLTLCAERVALVAAVGQGHRVVSRIAVFVAGSDDDPNNNHSDDDKTRAAIAPVPCGACLQFLAEFAALDTPIISATGPARTLGDYLPHPFRLDP